MRIARGNLDGELVAHTMLHYEVVAKDGVQEFDTYRFAPTNDITAAELARILEQLGLTLTFNIIEDLPPQCLRHFQYQSPPPPNDDTY